MVRLISASVRMVRRSRGRGVRRGPAFAAIIASDAGVDLVFGESGELVAAPFASDGHVPWVRRTARNPGHLGRGKPGSRGSACSYPTLAVQVSGSGSSA